MMIDGTEQTLAAWRVAQNSTAERETMLISCLAMGALRRIAYGKWGPLIRAPIGEFEIADPPDKQGTAYGEVPGVMGTVVDVEWALEHAYVAYYSTDMDAVVLSGRGARVAAALTMDRMSCPGCGHSDMDLWDVELRASAGAAIGCTVCHALWSPQALALMCIAE